MQLTLVTLRYCSLVCYRKSRNFRCSNIFRWPTSIRKLKARKFFDNKFIKQWDYACLLYFIVVGSCLLCLLTLANGHYTVRHLWLGAIWSDNIQCQLEWYWSAALQGSLPNNWSPYTMMTMNAWWPSQFLLSFDERQVMPHVSRRLSTGKFPVP